MLWQGKSMLQENKKVTLLLTKAYLILMIQGFADAITIASIGFNEWEVRCGQSILEKHLLHLGFARTNFFQSMIWFTF